ncbi:MAG TPA: AMP-binding protein, partial [Gammaproteobacteria bacterium]|nr:AMP-binding protein [Gammaproteobacteria bacterium]
MSRPAVIAKTAADLRVSPNLSDYEAACGAFSWQAVRQVLAGLPGGGFNLAYEAVDRHVVGSQAAKVAFRFLPESGDQQVLSYAELARLSNRFCNVLRHLGIGKGDRLFVLCGRIPALYLTVLGGLKNGTVVSPLFSAFGPEPVRTRINLGGG